MPDASTFGMWCGPLSRTLLDRSNGRDGSISTELSYPHRVRSAPDSDRTADIADWQLRAITGSRPFSLDHLVGDRQERRRDRESQRFCRLEIDHKLELCRAFDGQVGGLGALKDFVDEPGGASKRLNHAGPVGHEATSRCFVAGCT
jgi:hypothetical protein